MQQVSSLWKSIFATPGHATEVKAVIDGVVYSTDKLYSVNKACEAFQGQAPMVGACCAAQLSLELIPATQVPVMAEINLYVRLSYGEDVSEWIPAGTFLVDTRSKSKGGDLVSFTAFDSMLKLDQPYLEHSGLSTWPADDDDVADDIADAIGVSIDSRTVLAGYPVPIPDSDTTMREIMGWIGAANGGNWIITPENKLRLIKLEGKNSLLGEDDSTAILFGDSVIVLSTGYSYGDSTSADIQRNAQGFQNLGLLQPFTGVKVWVNRESTYEDQEVTVGGETTTEKVEVENAYFAGDETGRVLELDCPWGTQAMADALLLQIRGYCYQGATVDAAQLPPEAELGDTVICDGVGFNLSCLSVSYTGDYLPTIGAPADEEVDYEYHYESKVDRQLSRKVGLGDSYYGFKVTKKNGIEVENIVDGVPTTRMILNSSVQAFYNADGEAALYFDPVAGKYRFKGDVTITNGSLVLSSAFGIFPSDATVAEAEAVTVPDGLNLFGRYNGNLYNFFRVSQYEIYTNFDSPDGGYARWLFSNTTVTGNLSVQGQTGLNGYADYTYSGYSGAAAEIATVGKVAAMIADAMGS